MHESMGRMEYVGRELELFQWAENWKSYVASRLRRYLFGDVLEVGAGLGTNVPYLYRDDLSSFTSIEPDVALCREYRQKQENGSIASRCRLIEGTINTLPLESRYDAIVYIDVIEHIEDDRGEVQRALGHLKPGGHLCVLCPAHNFLFSSFDRSIGHYRRYNKSMYRSILNLQPRSLEYLDSVGMLASIANRLLLRQSYPTLNQIKVWDRVFVRCSRALDPLTLRLVGKSLLGIWQRPLE